ncbi:MAG: SIMPL domain-containing protein [Ilumatobacteraceae bacterium]
MPIVVVRGSAAASVTPDSAQLTLDVTHVAADAPTALQQVAARSRSLQDVLDRQGVAATDRVTAGIQVNDEYEWRDNTNVKVGHRATTAITVTVRAIDTVGALVAAAVGDAGVAVRHLAWQVDRDNPARARLLGDAARDARARASAYAEALGLAVGEVEMISEAPIGVEPGQPRALHMMADAAPMAKSMEVAVSEGVVELQSDVYVRFALV